MKQSDAQGKSPVTISRRSMVTSSGSAASSAVTAADAVPPPSDPFKLKPGVSDQTTAAEAGQPSGSRLYSALAFALASRIYYFLLAWTARQFAPDFDASSARPSTLIKWDAIHFEAIASHGYQHELQLAFFPLVPTAARGIAHVLGVSPGMGGLVCSNVMFFVAVVALYMLALKVTSSHHTAYSAAVLFAIQPASIFLMSMYTESTFAALTFLGMLAWEHDATSMTALAWSLACCTRSNALIHAGFFVYAALFQTRTLGAWVTNACGVASVVGAYLAVQAYGTYLFCSPAGPSSSWCPTSSSPFSLGFPYSHVQRKYWNVGLFRYWTLGNLPNFVIAGPMLTHSLVRIWCALVVPPMRNHSNAGWLQRAWRALQPAATGDLGPAYHVQHLVLVLVAVCGMHVQVAVRMFSSVPGVFVLPGGRGKEEDRKVKQWRRWWVVYSVVWSSVGAVLFGLFYPPA